MYKEMLKEMGKRRIKRMSFSQRLRELRTYHGVTPEDLAIVCNVTPQTVTGWEKMGRLPNVYTIARLANFFDTSIDDLIGTKYFPVAETQSYSLRSLVETDREEFISLYNHMLFGNWYGPKNSMEKQPHQNFFWEDFFNHQTTFIVQDKEMNLLIGYFYVKFPHHPSIIGTPDVGLQMDKKTKCDEELVTLAGAFLDYVDKKYIPKHIVNVQINSELEREIFEALGYENISKGATIMLRPREEH